ncbi:hypothetical protein [Streptomyces sp. NPDC090135]|uniref:hypothetical protein n=1 Tax=Streptomyces sp. NPDC090135 TaxID=3365957 RepID=UPI003830BB57
MLPRPSKPLELKPLTLTKPTGYSNQAAAQRMVALLSNPRSQLSEVTKAFRIAMRRLDHIVHASYTEDLDPLNLAVRAEVALQLVHGETGLTTVVLLEPVR